ncbi:Protein of unknown function, partial [Gryllus bimaculatus]
ITPQPLGDVTCVTSARVTRPALPRAAEGWPGGAGVGGEGARPWDAARTVASELPFAAAVSALRVFGLYDVRRCTAEGCGASEVSLRADCADAVITAGDVKRCPWRSRCSDLQISRAAMVPHSSKCDSPLLGAQ